MKNDEYAGQEEVVAAIRALTKKDHQKLMLIARYWHRKRYGPFEQQVEPAEILSEAITRTLNGDRRWRKGRVSLIKHLDRTMESVSGHLLQKRVDESQARAAVKSLPDRSKEGRSLPESSVEDEIIARQKLEIIEGLFSDDERALRVLRARAEEKTASEIRTELGISETEYESIGKRILRKFVKHARMLEGKNDDREER